jgi:hypothetical protein
MSEHSEPISMGAREHSERIKKHCVCRECGYSPEGAVLS